MQGKIIKNALVNAIAAAVYIMIVVAFMSHTQIIFGNKAPPNDMLVGMVMLLLFVISASVTGLLVLGKPIMWYLDGKRKEAITLFIYTVSFLILVFIVSLLLVIV